MTGVVAGTPVDAELAAALPVRSTVGLGRDTYVKVGENDWRRDVGEGYHSRHPIGDNQMVGTTVRTVGA